jgi:uncharacterized membrane protein
MLQQTNRFSIAQLLLLTTGVAVFCVVLMNENKWLRATYVTVSLGVALNALIAAIFARGERQAYSIGFVVGIAFFGLAVYSAVFTLPYLLTMELHQWLKATVASPPSDEHFAVVTGVFWVMLTATTSGFVSRRWYARSTEAEKS